MVTNDDQWQISLMGNARSNVQETDEVKHTKRSTGRFVSEPLNNCSEDTKNVERIFTIGRYIGENQWPVGSPR